jgi:Mn2+/Fe2+ NRAMP family transporter
VHHKKFWKIMMPNVHLPSLNSDDDMKQPPKLKLIEILGPGLVTGVSDDDPSGMATYSQTGAQFGYGIGWTLIVTYPLMCALQQISAEIGRVTAMVLLVICVNIFRIGYSMAWLDSC